MRSSICLALVVVIQLSATAAAQDEYDVDTPTNERWYGEGMIVVDSIALGIALGVFAGFHEPRSSGEESGGSGLWVLLTVPSFLTLAVVDPVVHWAHRNVWKGFVSLGLGITPLIAAGLTTDVDTPVALTVIGGTALVAKAIDIGLLAFEAPRFAAQSPSIGPSATLLEGGGTVGLAGVY